MNLALADESRAEPLTCERRDGRISPPMWLLQIAAQQRLRCATLKTYSHAGKLCCVTSAIGIPFGKPMGQKFFISFNSADRDKAHWIAWTLKEAGHEVADTGHEVAVHD